MRAFISHSGPDDRYVAEFVQLVRSLGFDEVFNDSHTIEPDETFWDIFVPACPLGHVPLGATE
jgi:hypothetical protein